eukprot:jgi/Mesvir1/1937/Mv22960-RA.4
MCVVHPRRSWPHLFFWPAATSAHTLSSLSADRLLLPNACVLLSTPHDPPRSRPPFGRNDRPPCILGGGIPVAAALQVSSQTGPPAPAMPQQGFPVRHPSADQCQPSLAPGGALLPDGLRAALLHDPALGAVRLQIAAAQVLHAVVRGAPPSVLLREMAVGQMAGSPMDGGMVAARGGTSHGMAPPPHRIPTGRGARQCLLEHVLEGVGAVLRHLDASTREGSGTPGGRLASRAADVIRCRVLALARYVDMLPGGRDTHRAQQLHRRRLRPDGSPAIAVMGGGPVGAAIGYAAGVHLVAGVSSTGGGQHRSTVHGFGGQLAGAVAPAPTVAHTASGGRPHNGEGADASRQRADVPSAPTPLGTRPVGEEDARDHAAPCALLVDVLCANTAREASARLLLAAAQENGGEVRVIGASHDSKLKRKREGEGKGNGIGQDAVHSGRGLWKGSEGGLVDATEQSTAPPMVQEDEARLLLRQGKGALLVGHAGAGGDRLGLFLSRKEEHGMAHTHPGGGSLHEAREGGAMPGHLGEVGAQRHGCNSTASRDTCQLHPPGSNSAPLALGRWPYLRLEEGATDAASSGQERGAWLQPTSRQGGASSRDAASLLADALHRLPAAIARAGLCCVSPVGLEWALVRMFENEEWALASATCHAVLSADSRTGGCWHDASAARSQAQGAPHAAASDVAGVYAGGRAHGCAGERGKGADARSCGCSEWMTGTARMGLLLARLLPAALTVEGRMRGGADQHRTGHMGREGHRVPLLGGVRVEGAGSDKPAALKDDDTGRGRAREWKAAGGHEGGGSRVPTACQDMQQSALALEDGFKEMISMLRTGGGSRTGGGGAGLLATVDVAGFVDDRMRMPRAGKGERGAHAGGGPAQSHPPSSDRSKKTCHRPTSSLCAATPLWLLRRLLSQIGHAAAASCVVALFAGMVRRAVEAEALAEMPAAPAGATQDPTVDVLRAAQGASRTDAHVPVRLSQGKLWSGRFAARFGLCSQVVTLGARGWALGRATRGEDARGQNAIAASAATTAETPRLSRSGSWVNVASLGKKPGTAGGRDVPANGAVHAPGVAGSAMDEPQENASHGHVGGDAARSAGGTVARKVGGGCRDDGLWVRPDMFVMSAKHVALPARVGMPPPHPSQQARSVHQELPAVTQPQQQQPLQQPPQQQQQQQQQQLPLPGPAAMGANLLASSTPSGLTKEEASPRPWPAIPVTEALGLFQAITQALVTPLVPDGGSDQVGSPSLSSLSRPPCDVRWLLALGDTSFLLGDAVSALRWYLLAATTASEFCTQRDRCLHEGVLSDDTLLRMAHCCAVLRMPAQGAALCQCVSPAVQPRASSVAFRLLWEQRGLLDPQYLAFFWHLPLLELLIALFSEGGYAPLSTGASAEALGATEPATSLIEKILLTLDGCEGGGSGHDDADVSRKLAGADGSGATVMSSHAANQVMGGHAHMATGPGPAESIHEAFVRQLTARSLQVPASQAKVDALNAVLQTPALNAHNAKHVRAKHIAMLKQSLLKQLSGDFVPC